MTAVAAAGQDSLQLFRSDLYHFQSLHPRLEGSPAARHVTELIAERLKQLGVAYFFQDFREVEEDHSFGESVITEIEGELPDSFLICVPIDHDTDRTIANDGAAGVALALEIARRAARSKPPLTIRIAFLAAENGNGGPEGLGTRRLLEETFPEAPMAVLYLDVRRVPAAVRIQAGADRMISPLWLVRDSLETMNRVGLPSAIDPLAFQLLRLGAASDSSRPIAAYLEQELPAVLLETNDVRLPMPIEDWYARFFAFFDALIRIHRDGIPRTWDTHYLFAEFGDRVVFVSETTYVIGVVILLGMAVFLVRLFQRSVSADLEETRRHLWLLPLLLGAVFLFLVGSTALIREIQRVRVNGQLWRAAPLLFLALKGVVASMMLVAFHVVVTRALRENLRRVTDRFFPTTALLLVLFDMFVVALVDISLTVYFVVPLILILAYEMVRSLHVRLVLTSLAALELLFFGLLMFLGPGTEFQRSVLLSTYRGNLILAAAVAPFVVLALDLSHGLAESTPAFRRLVLAILVGLSTVLVGAALVLPAFGPDHLQPVQVLQLVDVEGGENRILLNSPARLGSLTLQSGTTRRSFESQQRTLETTGEDPGNLLSISTSGQSILDRDNVQLILHSRGGPDRLRVAISSDSGFVVYDSEFPVTRELDGKRHVLHVGDFPPSPLTVNLTLPKSRTFTLEVTAEYADPPVALDVEGRYLSVERQLRFRRRFRVQT
jgi:hypothetical protein